MVAPGPETVGAPGVFGDGAEEAPSPPVTLPGDASLARELSEPDSAGADVEMLGDIRRMEVWEVVTNQVAFMSTPLLMPSLLARTGWVIGVGFVLYSTILTYMTALILGRICNEHPHLHTYALVAEEAFSQLAASLGAPRRLCGRLGAGVVGFLQFACYYLTGVAELIYFEQYLAALFEDVGLCQRQWLVIAAVMCWPCVQIPSFKESRWLALFACVMLAFNAFVFALEVAIARPWSHCDPGPQWPQPSGPDVVRGMTGIAYAFGGHGLFPEQLREMRKPEQWPRAVTCTYSVVLPLYVFFGCLGYFAFGHNAKANLNLNYPGNLMNHLSILAQAMQELYYVSSSMIVLVLQVELFLRVSPAACCRDPRELRPPIKKKKKKAAVWRPCRNADATDRAYFKSDMSNPASSPEAAVHADEPNCEAAAGEAANGSIGEVAGVPAASTGRCVSERWRGRLSLRNCGAPPVVFRLVFRTLFLGSQAVLAVLMLGGDGDVLLNLQALAGAVGYTALTYFLPLLFGWALLPKVGSASRLFYFLSFALCGLLMVVGIYFTAGRLLDTAGGLGAEVDCTIDAIEYTADACHAALGNALGNAN